MAIVYTPDADRLTQLGYETVAHVPVLFNSTGNYECIMNQYLRERALLEWHPAGKLSPVFRRYDYPKQKTLLNMAHSLKNFLEWCEQLSQDWHSVTYSEVLRYQKEMQSGDWSQKGRPLEPGTVNRRADEATHFLTWAAARGLRPPFQYPRVQSVRDITTGASARRQQKTIEVRAGRVRPSHTKAIKLLTTIPTVIEVRNWLHQIRQRRGYAKYLAARFILETGVRKEEITAVTIHQLLSLADLEYLQNRGQFMAPMDLTITKGDKPRTIQVPLAFTFELRQWADTKRLTLSYRYVKRTQRPAPQALFLSDRSGFEGIPLSGGSNLQIVCHSG